MINTITTLMIRRDLIKLWKQNNPILAKDEPALETDTRNLRIGDGVHPFMDLPIYKPYIKI